jgi:hypothetical protein
VTVVKVPGEVAVDTNIGLESPVDDARAEDAVVTVAIDAELEEAKVAFGVGEDEDGEAVFVVD